MAYTDIEFLKGRTCRSQLRTILNSGLIKDIEVEVKSQLTVPYIKNQKSVDRRLSFALVLMPGGNLEP